MWWLLAAASFIAAGLCGWGGWKIAFNAGARSRDEEVDFWVIKEYDARHAMADSLAKKDAEFAALLKLRVEEAARHRDQEHLSSVEIGQLIDQKHKLAEQIIALRGGRGQSMN